MMFLANFINIILETYDWLFMTQVNKHPSQSESSQHSRKYLQIMIWGYGFFWFFENTSPSRSLCPDNWFECELLWCSISFWIPNNELKNPSPDSPLLIMVDVHKADLLKILEFKGYTSLFDTFILDLKKWEISCSLTEKISKKL